MSLEAEIKALREAIEANTAAVLGGKSAGAAKSSKDEGADEPKTTRTRRSSANKDEEAKSKYTAEDVKAAAVKVKDELGTKAAKQLIKDHGADELAALKQAAYEDFIKACEKALNGDEGDDEGKDDL